jgi:hypothetical protein
MTWASELEVLDRFYATTFPVGCSHCGGIDRCHYGCVNWDEEELIAFEREHSRPATESEAHAEWHLNAGVPIGQPPCPWDACHGDDEWDTEPPTEGANHAVAC